MLKPECGPVEESIGIASLDDAPREKCGIVGIYSPDGNAVPAAYLAINALQHRGQDGAGFSYLEAGQDGAPTIEIKKALGRVATGFNNGADVAEITDPQYATAHVRYETSVAEDPLEALHPLKVTANGKDYTIAQNGQFDMDSLFQTAVEHGLKPNGTETDTELVAEILGASIEHHGHIEPALHNLLPQLEGAFNLSILSEDGVYAVRDRHGMRPLVLGKKGNAVMFASEVRGLTAPDSDARPQLDFEFEQEVSPGTYLVINEHGIREQRWSREDKKKCIFEYTYLSKPDNIIDGTLVRDYRFKAGEMLAKSDTVATDMVVPVLGSARSYAHGYAAASETPYSEALMKNPKRQNPNSDRTFIATTQEDREAAVDDKFVVDAEAVKGKSITLIDDSLVRGTTTRRIIKMLRDAGAKEIHIRIGSDVYSKPCKYGVNVQSEEELLAYDRTVDEMCDIIGADSLNFFSLKDMHKAVGAPKDEFCDGCMGGTYPEARPPSEQSALAV